MRTCVLCGLERVVMLAIAGRQQAYFMCGGCYAASGNGSPAAVEPRKLKRPASTGR